MTTMTSGILPCHKKFRHLLGSCVRGSDFLFAMGLCCIVQPNSLFVWFAFVVYDRKFLVGTIFFSHINQPAVLLHESATIRTSQPNRLTVLEIHFWFDLRAYLVPKKFHPKVSHRILRHMHGVLNVDEKKN